jgi:hypothetical protein
LNFGLINIWLWTRWIEKRHSLPLWYTPKVRSACVGNNQIHSAPFFHRSLLVFSLLAIMLSVLHRFTDSDYPFGIFKLFLMRRVGRGKCHNPYMYYNIPFICSINLHGVQTNPSCMEGKRQTPGMHDQFPFIYSNNPTVPAYRVSIYIFELIRYSREWVSYQDFHEKVGYKTMGSKLRSSLRKLYNLVNLYGMFVSQMTQTPSRSWIHRILNMSYSIQWASLMD